MKAHVTLVLAIASVATSVCHAQAQRVRVATYNIEFLNRDISEARAQHIRQVIEKLDADVIALQEIDDRAALQEVFDDSTWDLVIDDQSTDDQDVAVAVRHPLRARLASGAIGDGDAEDVDFLFSGVSNTFFPNRRDVLAVGVEVPDSSTVLFVLSQHAKSRAGGRANTEPRRAGAATRIVGQLDLDFDDRLFVLMGDMNDSPDDRSMNILEIGDPQAPFLMEEDPGTFLLNVTELLWAQGHCSFGRTEQHIVAGPGGTERVETINPEARSNNFNGLSSNNAPSPSRDDILFDQILLPSRMASMVIANTAKVFDDPVAVRGGRDAASDHLPVFVDLNLSDGDDSPPPTFREGMVVIRSLLANPDGRDEADGGRESITLRNTGDEITLDGWQFRDKGGTTFSLDGVTLPTNGTRQILIRPRTMPLTNSGDEIELVAPNGTVIHHVTYTSQQARSGREATFE